MEITGKLKRLRLPAMTKNTRRFVLAFGLTLGGVLLIVRGGHLPLGLQRSHCGKGNL